MIYEGYEEIEKEALRMWEKMQPQIRKMAEKVTGFSSMNEKEDYIYGLAYEAIYKGCLFYNKYKKRANFLLSEISGDDEISIKELSKISIHMKAETFCYWYLMKIFYSEVNTNEVCYIVITPEGSMETYINTEFRKKFNKEKIREMEKKGYKFITDRVFKIFSELVHDNDREEKELEIVDGDEEFKKYYRKNTMWR